MACEAWTSHLQLPDAFNTVSWWNLLFYSLKRKQREKQKDLFDFCFLFFSKRKNLLGHMWPYGAGPYWIGNWMECVICKLSEQEKNLFTFLRQVI